MSFFKKPTHEPTTPPVEELAETPVEPQINYARTASGERFRVESARTPTIIETNGAYRLQTGEIISTDDGQKFEFITVLPMTGSKSYLLCYPL